MKSPFLAGAGTAEITPPTPQFLYGYPHVPRVSTGVHDPLFSSALYLDDGRTRLMLIANDIIFVSKTLAQQARARIQQATGVPATNILISATHTHSGPITVDYISNETDEVVPPADPAYLAFFQDRIVDAARRAVESAEPARIGLAKADSTGIGTNRHDPAGPSDHQVPVLLVKSQKDERNIACLLVCSMHPTVLHEDSTLISADFPGFTRQILQEQVLGADCAVLHHTGPAGNQSPRHVTQGNTFAEAERLGRILAQAVGSALENLTLTERIDLACQSRLVDLPRKPLLSLQTAEKGLQDAHQRLQNLRDSGAPRQEIRTAECDWFGAEETLTLARAAEQNRLEAVVASCMPAEIQIMRIGQWHFVGWPGELFTEYALAVKQKTENTFVISLANGELQGYIVTPEAAQNRFYEASNALFAPDSGRIFVTETLRLLSKSHRIDQ